MTKSEFIKIKLTAHTPMFKNMIGLKPVFTETEKLADFVRFMHPKAEISVAEASATVYSDQNKYYTIYQNCILKNDHKTQKITMYKF